MEDHEIYYKCDVIKQKKMGYSDGEWEMRSDNLWLAPMNHRDIECTCGMEFDSRSEGQKHVEQIAWAREHLLDEGERPYQKGDVIEVVEDDVEVEVEVLDVEKDEITWVHRQEGMIDSEFTDDREWFRDYIDSTKEDTELIEA